MSEPCFHPRYVDWGGIDMVQHTTSGYTMFCFRCDRFILTPVPWEDVK